MAATCNGGDINGVDDVHAAGRVGPDESVMRMNQRRRPSADRRCHCCTDVATAPDCYGDMLPVLWTRAWTSRQCGRLSRRRHAAGAGHRDIDADQRQPKRPDVLPSL